MCYAVARMGHYDDLYDEKRGAEEARVRENQKKLEETPHFKSCRGLQKSFLKISMLRFCGSVADFLFVSEFVNKNPLYITEGELKKACSLADQLIDSR